jgi:hypothetical protein
MGTDPPRAHARLEKIRVATSSCATFEALPTKAPLYASRIARAPRARTLRGALARDRLVSCHGVGARQLFDRHGQLVNKAPTGGGTPGTTAADGRCRGMPAAGRAATPAVAAEARGRLRRRRRQWPPTLLANRARSRARVVPEGVSSCEDPFYGLWDHVCARWAEAPGPQPLAPMAPRPSEPRFVRCRCRRRCPRGARRASALTKTRAARARAEVSPRLRTVYQVPSKTGISVTEALRWEDIKCLTGGPCRKDHDNAEHTDEGDPGFGKGVSARVAVARCGTGAAWRHLPALRGQQCDDPLLQARGTAKSRGSGTRIGAHRLCRGRSNQAALPGLIGAAHLWKT